MTITYTWSLNNELCEVDVVTGFVASVPWRYTGTDGTYSAFRYGRQTLDITNPAEQVLASSLSSATLLAIAQAKFADQIGTMRADIAAQIADQVARAATITLAPWQPPPGGVPDTVP